FSEILENKIIQDKLPLLIQSASGIGNLQIRNRATVVGNFVNNAPCADSVPALLVYNAKLRIESLKGAREIALQDFLVKAYKTQIAPDELVTDIQIPLANDFCGTFYKLGRRQSVAISRISLAVLAKLSNHKIDEIRIASGAVTPIGKRFTELENFARGKIANKDLFIELAQKIARQTLDVTGLRWSGFHKIPVLQQALYQLLLTTIEL
ncbi:MAG: FAD binding domain-containing protein, partial [Calditrichaeota bacterium]|nr:FAD binding domain-containing protein [Calditrichota bacterium]